MQTGGESCLDCTAGEGREGRSGKLGIERDGEIVRRRRQKEGEGLEDTKRGEGVIGVAGVVERGR
jgi:hypothetical protein